MERVGEFLPRHWNRPQLGHCRRILRSAGLQCCDHVVALPEPVQQANGKRIAGTCRVYLVGCNGINMHFAGGSVSIRPLPPSRDHDPLESLTRTGQPTTTVSSLSATVQVNDPIEYSSGTRSRYCCGGRLYQLEP